LKLNLTDQAKAKQTAGKVW